jgi:hypothetical protein
LFVVAGNAHFAATSSQWPHIHDEPGAARFVLLLLSWSFAGTKI